MLIKAISAHETYAIRQRVLRPHQTMDEVAFAGDDEPDTFHLGAFDAGYLVGIVSLYQQTTPKLVLDKPWQLRGMATLPEYQGQGSGRSLVLAALDEIKLRCGANIWCNAREVALTFYQKLAFKVHGDPFEIPGIGPHYMMWRNV